MDGVDINTMNNSELTKKRCIPCEGGVEPFTSDQISKYLEELKHTWNVVDEKKISHEFEFESFMEAVAFVEKVAELAESEGHHPDISIHYKKVTIELWTHSIKGLSENDFILAAKIENL